MLVTLTYQERAAGNATGSNQLLYLKAICKEKSPSVCPLGYHCAISAQPYEFKRRPLESLEHS